MSTIHVLPDLVANKIAAGEVVERPASVVKELLENALDAGAQRVEIEVEAGGRKRIRVADNGCGMGRDDAVQAFERHATSKIRQLEDLLAIATLGFRGEALPAMAAVSRLSLETRLSSEATGTHLEIWGGKLRNVRESAWVGGTEIEVRDLFYNVPVRRKFLRSESTELAHIASLVTHYAIAHPEKSFKLKTASRHLVDVASVRERRERAFQLLGGQLLDQLVEIPRVERTIFEYPPSYEGTDESPSDLESRHIVLSGFVSRPEVQRLNRKQIFIFVNGRLVRDRLLLHAVGEAYRNILPSRMFPVALVFLEISAQEVDVNVHPTKMEVRFRRSSFVHDFTRDSIYQVLVSSRPIADFPSTRTKLPSPFAFSTQYRKTLTPFNEPPSSAVRGMGETRQRADFRLKTPPLEEQEAPLPFKSNAVLSVYAPPKGTFISTSPSETSDSEARAVAGVPSDPHALEGLNPLGQVQNSFIIAENHAGLWIIDQHVAHERILFENHLQRRLHNQVECQRLLLPLVVELNPGQMATFQGLASEFTADGFEIELFGKNTVAVKSVPVEVPHDRVEKLLVQILDEVEKEARDFSLEKLRIQIATSVACHGAIKINTPLEEEKMEWILRELIRTKCPMSCPHGRPIILRYSLEDIRKAFKRT